MGRYYDPELGDYDSRAEWLADANEMDAKHPGWDEPKQVRRLQWIVMRLWRPRNVMWFMLSTAVVIALVDGVYASLGWFCAALIADTWRREKAA